MNGTNRMASRQAGRNAAAGGERQRVVVLGAGYAGLLVTRSLARHLPESAELTLVNERDRFVERMRMHQLATGQVLPYIPLTESMGDTGVDVVIGTVDSLDTDGRCVSFENGRRIDYDYLVYALGSRSLRAPEGAIAVADFESASRLRQQLSDLRSGRVVVVGGGLTGLETVSEIAERRNDLDVHLISRGAVDAGMTPGAGRRTRASLHALGVSVREGVRVEAGSDGGFHEVDADGNARRLNADLVIWSVGFIASALAANAGLRVDRQRRVIVDDRLRSIDDPRIYAIGDAGVIDGPDGLARMSCQTAVVMASWLGKRLGRQIAGKAVPAHRPRFVWRNISLGRRDGLTQFTHWDDRPLPIFLSGRTAAGFKELVNYFVTWQVTGLRPRRKAVV